MDVKSGVVNCGEFADDPSERPSAGNGERLGKVFDRQDYRAFAARDICPFRRKVFGRGEHLFICKMLIMDLFDLVA